MPKELIEQYGFTEDKCKQTKFCLQIVFFKTTVCTNFKQKIEDELNSFIKAFEYVKPPGIALNQALKENLFMLFLCIMTKVPLLLVGKPGSSKTLAIQIIRDALSDPISVKEFVKHSKLDAKVVTCLHFSTFQCSKQSKAEGIQRRWELAQKILEKKKDVLPVLLLDEIGLAEKSKHRPLKILHQLLENPKISFVGLSNWSLDAAKMNRCIMHKCPPHRKKDLISTGEAIQNKYTVFGFFNATLQNGKTS